MGRRTSLAYPNGVSTGYGYDAAGRLDQIASYLGTFGFGQEK
ncbi:MAG: RHS repeat domain-containing protein [Thermodesulfobacteriota bacterium]